MILKCSKTGKIFFNETEAKEHAELLGVSDFVEVAATDKVWLHRETGKFCNSQNEVEVFCRRSGLTLQDFCAVDLTELSAFLESRKSERRNPVEVEKFANIKLLDALIDVRGYSVIKAEKALWMVSNESAEKADQWIRDNQKDELLNTPWKEVPTTGGPVKAMSDDKGDHAPLAAMPDYVISNINTQTIAEIVEMGFTERRAQKAVYLTRNGGTAAAVEWLSLHANDFDIDAVPKQILSKEEAQAQANELQKKMRLEREAREKQEAIDREKARIAQTKLVVEAQAVLDEENRKRDIMLREKEKADEAEHRRILKQKLRDDYMDRFGVPPPDDEGQENETLTKMKPKDQVIYWIQQLKKNKGDNPAGLKVCMTTLKAYLGNIEQNSAEPKFKKIRKDSKAFSERVAGFTGAAELLKACGFIEDSESFEIKAAIADGWLCGQAAKFLDIAINQL